MSQQPPTSSPDYASPPSNQLQNDSAGDQQISGGPPATFQGKPIEEILSGFTPFNTAEHLEQHLQAEIERDGRFIYEQSLEFLELAMEAWARILARIPSTTQADSVLLSEMLKAVLDREKQQGMSAPLISSDSARPGGLSFNSLPIFSLRHARPWGTSFLDFAL